MCFDVIGFCTDSLEKRGGSKSINAAARHNWIRIIRIMLIIGLFCPVFLRLRNNLRKNLTKSLHCGTRTRPHATVSQCVKSTFNLFSLAIDYIVKQLSRLSVQVAHAYIDSHVALSRVIFCVHL